MSGHGPEGHGGGHDAPKHESHSHGGGHAAKGLDELGDMLAGSFTKGIGPGLGDVVKNAFGLKDKEAKGGHH